MNVVKTGEEALWFVVCYGEVLLCCMASKDVQQQVQGEEGEDGEVYEKGSCAVLIEIRSYNLMVMYNEV